MALQSWLSSSDEVCRRIAATKAVLKIVLKIKDDPLMFERWIAHHLQVVDPSRIIVLDNESTDVSLHRMYGEIPLETTLVSFGGFHNHVHNAERFRKLYDALATSADYAIFLDVDEFLYWCDGTTIRADRSLSDHLARSDRHALFPGLWLQNRDGSLDEFIAGDVAGRPIFEHGYRWGKSVIPMRRPALKAFINHTIQLLENNTFADIEGGALVFHASRYDAGQRIAANIRKIVVKGYLSPGEDWREGLAPDRLAKADPHVRAYLRELVEHSARKEFRYVPPVEGTEGWVRFNRTTGRVDGHPATLDGFFRTVFSPNDFLSRS
jgi:hypothetical protein